MAITLEITKAERARLQMILSAEIASTRTAARTAEACSDSANFFIDELAALEKLSKKLDEA